MASEFFCNSCGAKSLKWSGRCARCGEWNTMEEKRSATSNTKKWIDSSQKPHLLSDIDTEKGAERWETKVHEFDRVVGGGIIKGSMGLLGGNPGVGKSTLILQLLARLAKIGKKVLYISGEESTYQIKHRSDRLLIDQKTILVLVESDLENIMNHLLEIQPDFVVIDSIQTLYTEQLSASPGSVSQVRESASILTKFAKQHQMAVMLIGHVTKGGDIAGPRTLEHMVDYVLYLEGEKREQQRILRSVKNRFGTINEIGLFKMTGKGLSEISKMDQLFVEQIDSHHSGTAFFAACQGSRILFTEIQVLVGDTQQNTPVRTSVGLERNRLQVIIAVLEKHLDLNFSRNDIYVNLTGGLKTQEPAIDLAVTAAIISSHLQKPLPKKSVFVGEVALTGELRTVYSMPERINEAQRCGFNEIYVPHQSDRKLESISQKSKSQIISVKDVNHLFDLIGR